MSHFVVASWRYLISPRLFLSFPIWQASIFFPHSLIFRITDHHSITICTCLCLPHRWWYLCPQTPAVSTTTIVHQYPVLPLSLLWIWDLLSAPAADPVKPSVKKFMVCYRNVHHQWCFVMVLLSGELLLGKTVGKPLLTFFAVNNKTFWVASVTSCWCLKGKPNLCLYARCSISPICKYCILSYSRRNNTCWECGSIQNQAGRNKRSSLSFARQALRGLFRWSAGTEMRTTGPWFCKNILFSCYFCRSAILPLFSSPWWLWVVGSAGTSLVEGQAWRWGANADWAPW